MKKVIFFENYDGRLHRCIFAGLDNNNRPQWVKVDQGEEMMSLQDYMEANCLKGEDMRVLCVEGETLESATMAQLLGAVLQGYPCVYIKALADAIKNLRNMGIGWKQDKLQMFISVYKYYDDVNQKDAFRFCIDCNRFGDIVEMDNFFNMKELMDVVRCYFEALEKWCGIDLSKELWSNNVNLDRDLDSEDKELFDLIDYRR